MRGSLVVPRHRATILKIDLARRASARCPDHTASRDRERTLGDSSGCYGNANGAVHLGCTPPHSLLLATGFHSQPTARLHKPGSCAAVVCRCVCVRFSRSWTCTGGAELLLARLLCTSIASVHCNNDGLMGRHSRSNRWPGFDRFQHNRRNRKRGDQACVGRDLCRGGEVLLVGASSAARSAADMTYNVTYNPATASAPGLPR